MRRRSVLTQELAGDHDQLRAEAPVEMLSAFERMSPPGKTEQYLPSSLPLRVKDRHPTRNGAPAPRNSRELLAAKRTRITTDGVHTFFPLNTAQDFFDAINSQIHTC